MLCSAVCVCFASGVKISNNLELVAVAALSHHIVALQQEISAALSAACFASGVCYLQRGAGDTTELDAGMRFIPRRGWFSNPDSIPRLVGETQK